MPKPYIGGETMNSKHMMRRPYLTECGEDWVDKVYVRWHFRDLPKRSRICKACSEVVGGRDAIGPERYIGKRV